VEISTPRFGWMSIDTLDVSVGFGHAIVVSHPLSIQVLRRHETRRSLSWIGQTVTPPTTARESSCRHMISSGLMVSVSKRGLLLRTRRGPIVQGVIFGSFDWLKVNFLQAGVKGQVHSREGSNMSFFTWQIVGVVWSLTNEFPRDCCPTSRNSVIVFS
jgi:hypothetical protein